MADLHRLLDVQDRDVHLEQLQHRRETLDDRAALASQLATRSHLSLELAEVAEQLSVQLRSQKKIEDEVSVIESKAATETRKLNSGTVTAPREIQSLSDEIDALGRRQRTLEDQELEIMEAVETLAGEVDALTSMRDAAAAEADRLRAAIDEQVHVIDDEIASITVERDAAVAEIPDELLARYDKLRAKLDGVAVARLEGDRCLGCHVSLPAMEVDAARHAAPDAVVIHEDCGRILVR